MAWEWLAPVSGAVVGVAGVASGALYPSAGRRQEIRLAAERHHHERALTHEQWLRDRRAETYVELLDTAEVIRMLVELVHPFIGPAPEPPELPSFETQQRVFARVMAFGSDGVKSCVDRWRGQALQAIRIAEAISRRDGGNDRQVLQDLRHREKTARQELGDAVAMDLQRPALGWLAPETT